MPQLHAYLSFNGQCAEAMAFYAQLFGAKVEALIPFGQMPGGEPVPSEFADKIMHAYLVHPDFSLMAGDLPPGVTYEGVKGVMMTLSYDTAAEAKRILAALAEGGSVQMPLAETFWAEVFGMCTDRFGTPWGVNGGSKQMPGA